MRTVMDFHKSKSTERLRLKPLKHSPSVTENSVLEKTVNDMEKGFRGKLLMSTQSPSIHRLIEKQQSQPQTTDRNKTDSSAREISIGHPQTSGSMGIGKQEELFKTFNTLSGYSDLRPSSNFEFFSPKMRNLISEKDKEIEHLRRRMNELERDIASKNMLNKSFLDYDSQVSLNMEDLEKDDPEKQKHILIGLTLKTHETYKFLKERCNGLARLNGMLEHGLIKGINENEFIKIKMTLDELAATLAHASKTEIELGLKTRENEKKQLELAKLRSDHMKIIDQNKKQVEELTYVKKLRNDLQDKLAESNKFLDQQKHQNLELEKKIEKLEKRIELILEADISMDKDKLRRAITELVKENEDLKRKDFTKNKEIKKNKDELSKMKTKYIRQTKKVENLTKARKGHGASTSTEELERSLFAERNPQEQTLSLLHQNVIPTTLDFRTSSLKFQYAELLNDVVEQGSGVFLEQLKIMATDKDRQEALLLMTSQLVSNREFAEKLHFFVRESLELLKMRDLREAMIFMNKYFKHVFASEHLNLWVPDGSTGIFYTHNASRQEMRCLSTKGLINDVIKYGKPYNKRNMTNSIMCELTMPEGKYKVDNTLVIPVKNASDKIIAILEISNIMDSHFGFDDEYFGLALGQLSTLLLQKIYQENSVNQVTKMRQMLLEALIHFTGSEDVHDLAFNVKSWAYRIFGVSTTRILFVENGQFLVFSGENELKKQDCRTGISGQAYLTKKTIILSDVQSNKDYNPLVDLSSILPVVYSPVVLNPGQQNAEVAGIFQLVVKPKGSKKEDLHERYDDVLGAIAMDEPLEQTVHVFSEFVATALSIIKKKAGTK